MTFQWVIASRKYQFFKLFRELVHFRESNPSPSATMISQVSDLARIRDSDPCSAAFRSGAERTADKEFCWLRINPRSRPHRSSPAGEAGRIGAEAWPEGPLAGPGRARTWSLNRELPPWPPRLESSEWRFRRGVVPVFPPPTPPQRPRFRFDFGWHPDGCWTPGHRFLGFRFDEPGIPEGDRVRPPRRRHPTPSPRWPWIRPWKAAGSRIRILGNRSPCGLHPAGYRMSPHRMNVTQPSTIDRRSVHDQSPTSVGFAP